jgi:hypothetical protein
MPATGEVLPYMDRDGADDAIAATLSSLFACCKKTAKEAKAEVKK